ncbi:hypothetical protein AFLA_006967 [Aspergillus flavus NRRL3357]|nr:hypothetical protein AFLA_006967 [Aspergillus flavus NRRL3357]
MYPYKAMISINQALTAKSYCSMMIDQLIRWRLVWVFAHLTRVALHWSSWQSQGANELKILLRTTSWRGSEVCDVACRPWILFDSSSVYHRQIGVAIQYEVPAINEMWTTTPRISGTSGSPAAPCRASFLRPALSDTSDAFQIW